MEAVELPPDDVGALGGVFHAVLRLLQFALGSIEALGKAGKFHAELLEGAHELARTLFDGGGAEARLKER